jgi:glycosyltransferase involved in cell wall biosynthesis
MQNETILCVAPRDWHGLWKDTQSIMSRIAAQNRVIYFDPSHDGQASWLHELFDNLPNFFQLRMDAVQKNLTVIPTPPSLPLARRHLPQRMLRIVMPLVVKANTWILCRHVRRAMKALQIERPILWLYGPYQAGLIGKFGEKLACYFNYDEFADFVANRRIKDLIRQHEAELCRQVDIVFATSRAQCQVRSAYNPHTYLIPNAVDFELFNRALLPGLEVPDDIARVSRPIIGYAGRLAYQIDVELLHRVATAYPRCSLVFVGPDELPNTEAVQALRALSNVFFLGVKSPSDLPTYLQVFDVALIPYRLVGHVLSGYPTKLHEYLAAGRAVVATAMPELRPYSHVLRIGETEDDFIRCVGEAIQDNSSSAIAARLAVAQENTWDRRVADIYHVLDSLLSESDPVQRSRLTLANMEQRIDGELHREVSL